MTIATPLGSVLDPPDIVTSSADPMLGHTWADRFVAAIGDAEPGRSLEVYGEAPSWEDRWFCLEAAAGYERTAEVALDWARQWPGHPFPELLGAAIGAFEANPAAGDTLGRLGVDDPESPLVDGLQLVLAAGLGRGAVDSEEHLAALLSKGLLYEPHVRFLTTCAPSNGGSVQAMIDFARTVCEVVPPGSVLRALMPLSAIGAMMAAQPDDHLSYLGDLGVVDDVLMAAGQSVFHPAFAGQPRVPMLKAMNAFAVGLSLIDHDDLALHLVDRLGESFTPWPLALLGEPSSSTWHEFRLLTSQRAEAAAARRW